MKLRDASLQVYEKKKHFHTSSFMYFCIHFLRIHHDYFVQRGFESVRVQFLSAKVVFLVIYLFNHDSSKSTIFMLNVAFDVLLSAGFVKSSKSKSFVSCNIKLFALCFDMYFFYVDICIKFTLSKTISARKE